jgi:hypothetical protein
MKYIIFDYLFVNGGREIKILKEDDPNLILEFDLLQNMKSYNKKREILGLPIIKLCVISFK